MAEISRERRQAVDQARERWMERLIDHSRRNSLLYLRDLKTGTLDLSDAAPEAIARLLSGDTVPLSRLLLRATEDQVSQTLTRVKDIRRRARVNLEEKGLETLFLALGMATWTPADGGRPPASAVLLAPMAVETHGREGRSFSLRGTGEVQVNLVLLHVLETDYGCKVTPESLLEAISGEQESDNEAEERGFDPSAVFARLTSFAAGVKGFQVRPRAALGNFSYQKMAMVKDLRERAVEMAQHDLVAAIAGDAMARQAILGARQEIDPREFDRTPPENDFLILDADSSQQRVVAAVLTSQDGVILGPPGTGKSQTITNLMAALAAQGRRVLFVAEKRAALEVVLRRLNEAGLDYLVLDLHGADISRREIMRRLSASLRLVREAIPVDTVEVHQRLVERRTRLNEHVARLHKPRAPSGMSAFEIQGRLLHLPHATHSSVRWRGPDLELLDAKNASAVQLLLAEAGGFAGLFLRDDPSPWTGSLLPDGATVQRAIDLVTRLATKRWPALRASLTALASATGLSAPTTLGEVGAFLSLLQEVASTLALYLPDIFRKDLPGLASTLSPARGGPLSAFWAWLTSGEYRGARQSARALRRAGPTSAAQLHKEISAAADQLRRWRDLSSPAAIPLAAPGLDVACGEIEAALADLRELALVLDPRHGLDDLSQPALGTVERLLGALSTDSTTPHRIPRLLEIEREIERRGAGRIIAELRSVEPEARTRQSSPEECAVRRAEIEELKGRADESAQAQAALGELGDVLCGASVTRGVGDALVRGYYARASHALVDIAKQADKIPAQGRQELAEQMRKAAERTQNLNPEMSQRTAEAAQALESGDLRAAQSVMEAMARAINQASRWLFPKVFEHAWLASCLDHAREEDPAVAGFNGQTHQSFVGEFCSLDRKRLKLAAARVQRAHAERVITVMNAHPDQEAIVRREAAKRARHLPLRTLLAQTPDVLTALCPCWMASPLSVSQLLGADRRYFDVVIFDEASQVLPEDAVPALLRASRAVVAGDRHQLRPTTFFAAGEDEAEGDDGSPVPTAGFESVLDLMRVLLPLWRLEWHYRSRDERLIAFSNRHIYEPASDGFITFPGPGGPPPLSHVLVPHVSGQDRQEESASAEVQRVVELVLQHAVERPKETLGVIALGLPHARRVEAALDLQLRSRPDLDAFFDQSREERFFVKNLERVQGDERDAIILTVGYGKDHAGNLHYHFGPLLEEGGERRLNVAITRARHRMTLVSSFDHHDMDPSRSRARGVELLRLYLEYAASGGSRLGDDGHTSVPLNPFEQDVCNALTARGLKLLPQWGASRYRIDLVVQHPERPGRFVLAIECDGASYHSAPTARDRDRLRQQHLEALGWRFHRVWSTDWFMRREEEIDRTLAAFKAAVSYVDQEDQRIADSATTAPSGTPAPSPELSPPPEPQIPKRGPRPKVIWRGSIGEYKRADIEALIVWLQSDGRLRTDDEIVDEMVAELDFKRRGTKIEKTIRSATGRLRIAGKIR